MIGMDGEVPPQKIMFVEFHKVLHSLASVQLLACHTLIPLCAIQRPTGKSCCVLAPLLYLWQYTSNAIVTGIYV